jgi:hypothetical protein
MKVLAVAAAACLVAGSVRVDAQAPATAPTAGAAESLAKKLTSIEARKREKTRKPETVVVTEHELNSYLNLKMAADMPTGVSDVQVSMQSERLQATGQVDLDKLDIKKGSSPFSPLALLSGKVPVMLRGRLQSLDGFGNVQIEEVQLATIPVPVSVLERLIASSTKSARNPEGFDIHAPFRFPYSVRRVRIEPGRALLDF